MKNPRPKTGAERQQALKERREALGLKQYRNLWGYPEDEERVKAYVARLVKARGKR